MILTSMHIARHFDSFASAYLQSCGFLHSDVYVQQSLEILKGQDGRRQESKPHKEKIYANIAYDKANPSLAFVLINADLLRFKNLSMRHKSFVEAIKQNQSLRVYFCNLPKSVTDCSSLRVGFASAAIQSEDSRNFVIARQGAALAWQSIS